MQIREASLVHNAPNAFITVVQVGRTMIHPVIHYSRRPLLATEFGDVLFDVLKDSRLEAWT